MDSPTTELLWFLRRSEDFCKLRDARRPDPQALQAAKQAMNEAQRTFHDQLDAENVA